MKVRSEGPKRTAEEEDRICLFVCGVGSRYRSTSRSSGMGARAEDRRWVRTREGQTVHAALAAVGKTVTALVTVRGSQAGRKGYDAVVMVCSRECGAQLKAALLLESGLLGQVTAPSLGPGKPTSE